MENEIWKDIKGWEGLYQISNLGRVKSLDRKIISSCFAGKRNGEYIRNKKEVLKKGRVLTPVANNRGYYRVQLKLRSRMERPFIHRLVAVHFLKNVDNKPCVNHIDFNVTNNAHTNLEWCTHNENMQHSIKHGRFKRTDEWLKNLKESQKRFYKSVIGINQENGYIVISEKLNGVKEYGFSPGEVCRSCKSNTALTKGYKFYYRQNIETMSTAEIERLGVK